MFFSRKARTEAESQRDHDRNHEDDRHLVAMFNEARTPGDIRYVTELARMRRSAR